MSKLGTEARSLRALKRLPLVNSIDDNRWELLSDHISFTEVDEGETLFSAGHQSENLFMVIDGELCLFLPCQSNNEHFLVNSRKRGDTAGDFAVLNGGEHLVTAIAAKKTRVACFPRFAFDLLTDVDPKILAIVYDTAAELSRRVVLARVFLDLFTEVTVATMNELLEATVIRHYRTGELLFAQGDDADGLNIVVSGRLAVARPNAAGELETITEIRSAETVGELALLQAGTRSATVYAQRESTVAFLEKQYFDELIALRPHMLLPLARLVVQRNTIHYDSKHQRPDASFVIVSLDKRLPLRRFLRQLRNTLRAEGNPLLLDSRTFDTLYGKKNAAQIAFTDVFNSAVAEWLDDKENRHSQILYVADREWTEWTQRCVNRADRILLLADGSKDNDPSLREIEKQLHEAYKDARAKPKLDLVLLHPRTTHMPEGTRYWLQPRELDSFHHLRVADDDHIARLARHLIGKTRCLILSGGGARGFAHLGVKQYFEENDIAIDSIGGASMGALLGATMAMGKDYQSIRTLCHSFANKRALFDYTFPAAALMKSAKLTRFCQKVYGDQLIEDLWIPFFAVSSNLSDGCEVIHDRGKLWHAVRSTISLPGIFTPVACSDDSLLIDGAVLNTFPVDVMHQRMEGKGFYIGVNVSQIAEVKHRYDYGTMLSGWRVLLSRLHPFSERMASPRIVETLLRSTDIKGIARMHETKALLDTIIEPDVSKVSLMEFKSYADISTIGYLAASERFTHCPAWLDNCQPTIALEPSQLTLATEPLPTDPLLMPGHSALRGSEGA